MEKVKNIKYINHLLQSLYSVFGILLTTISSFIVICSFYLFIQFIIKPNSPPTIFDVIPQIIMTNDISDGDGIQIKKGDLVFIKKVPIEKIEIHNTIAYIDNGDILVSTVTGIKANGSIKVIVCADNTETEFLISDYQIFGIISQRVAYVGEFLYFTQSIAGIIIFIVVPSLSLITLFACSIINKKGNKINQKTDFGENKDISDLPNEKTKAKNDINLIDIPKTKAKAKTAIITVPTSSVKAKIAIITVPTSSVKAKTAIITVPISSVKAKAKTAIITVPTSSVKAKTTIIKVPTSSVKAKAKTAIINVSTNKVKEQEKKAKPTNTAKARIINVVDKKKTKN